MQERVVGQWRRGRLGFAWGIWVALLGFSRPADAQVVELQSIKTQRQYEARQRQWARAKVDLDWRGIAVIDAARELSNRLLLPIVPTAGVREAERAGTLPRIEFVQTNATVLGALEAIKTSTGLCLVDHGRSLRLALPSEVVPEVSVQFYSVWELTFILRDFEPPIGFGLRGSNQEPEAPTEFETRTASGFDEQGLADLIRKLTPKAGWDRGDVSIEVARGLLIVRQTPRMHRAVAGVLRELGRRA